jgi:hypothetical protein
MNTEKIKNIESRIKKNRDKLKKETGNLKNQQILRLEITIDELEIKKERLKD